MWLEPIARGEADHGRLLSRWRYGDSVEPARYFIYRAVNEALRGKIHRVCLPYQGKAIRYFPDSLIAAIYIRLQDRLAGKAAQERVCKNERCPQVTFVPKRRDQEYCSKSCRQMANYYGG